VGGGQIADETRVPTEHLRATAAAGVVAVYCVSAAVAGVAVAVAVLELVAAVSAL
jgi:hypothetical protein